MVLPVVAVLKTFLINFIWKLSFDSYSDKKIMQIQLHIQVYTFVYIAAIQNINLLFAFLVRTWFLKTHRHWNYCQNCYAN